MCGITGFLSSASITSPEVVLAEMIHRIRHRGPDDSGVWIDSNVGLGLAHARLSIQDLSTLGHQPMRSTSGRYTVVFNGELYNFQVLRTALKQQGFIFRSSSDTEVLLAAIEHWGLEKAVVQFVGMFALAVWDAYSKTLFLVRDRMGEKPLYYGQQRNTLLFASELSAFKAFPGWQGAIDRNSLASLLKFGYIPAPCSIYQAVYKVEPGTIKSFNHRGEPGLTIRYWCAETIARAPSQVQPIDDLAAELERLLGDAIRTQMIADVPVGAFLSGGVDSSLVVALMQKYGHQPVNTFSIGYTDQRYNEAQYAKRVANHLGTEHTELYVEPADLLNVIPNLPSLYSEPFADASQIPTYLVSQMARKNVTVCLSGDGGDELFGGYNRYVWGPRIWSKIHRLPMWSRKIGRKMLCSFSPNRWSWVYDRCARIVPSMSGQRLVGEKIHKTAGLLDVATQRDLYSRLVSQWQTPEQVVVQAHCPKTMLDCDAIWGGTSSFPEQMMLADQLSYLTDDILVKVDRAAMAVGLEVRIPMLNHHIVEFAWRLPMSARIHQGETKRILRHILYRHVPKALIERPKMGFGIPIDDWLRGPLKVWAEDLLNVSSMKQAGYFDAKIVQQVWREHMSGKFNRQYQLWPVLMFQAWLRAQN